MKYLIRSNFGNKGNFEAVSYEGNYLVHYWRNNDAQDLQWNRGPSFGDNVGSIPTMLQSNFGNRGNFELVVRERNQLRHYWRDNDAQGFPWRVGPLFGNNANSPSAMLQSNFGNRGNFELVVREGTQLRHYWRNNDAQDLQWNEGVLFGDNVGSGPTMLQSNFGNKGNFELVVREGNQLRHYWRNNDAQDLQWNKGVLFGDNVGSAPSMIQSNFGNKGNFELIVREGNQLRHYWRNNDAQDLPWNKGVLF